MKVNALLLLVPIAFCACNSTRRIEKTAKQTVLDEPALRNAHVGITIFDPAAGKYWYNYQGDHYFVPASNTKIATCYAAMKYLGDSLTGIFKAENDTALILMPNGDPSLLHPDFQQQPVIDLIRRSTKKVCVAPAPWQNDALGPGWAWNDYNDDYMAERSALPVYGNVLKWVQEKGSEGPLVYSIPEVTWAVDFDTVKARNFFVRRALNENIYEITEGNEKLREQDVPFVTHGMRSALELLADTVHKTVGLCPADLQSALVNYAPGVAPIHSQPTDSLLKPMMHRSDNFFAEQSLVMVSNAILHEMNDEKVIDTLLKTDFKDLPQKPRWVDGSGLSRYNLFSPQDLVAILDKMKNDFGMDRIKNILATGNEGTLHNYYLAEHGYIFAKTGTLSGVVSISGFLYTKRNKLLIFSVLVNNHNGSPTEVRRSVEKFIETLRNNF